MLQFTLFHENSSMLFRQFVLNSRLTEKNKVILSKNGDERLKIRRKSFLVCLEFTGKSI